MLENLAKKSHFYNISSEARYFHLHLEWSAQKESILASFWEPEACGQIVLPDRSVSIGQKLVKNAKIGKLKMRHFEEFSNTVECKEMEYFHMFLPKFPFHLHRSPASFDR